jgi:Flp pilus assembly pilin Flp
MLKNVVHGFRLDDKAVTAIEYALIAAVIVTALGTLGNDVGNSFNSVACEL